MTLGTLRVRRRWLAALAATGMFAVAALVAVLILWPGGTSAPASQDNAAAATAGEPAVAQESSSGTGEGIHVHGAWTIEVRNPDGSLASHNEFENAVTAAGAISLEDVLVEGYSGLPAPSEMFVKLFEVGHPIEILTFRAGTGGFGSGNLRVEFPISGVNKDKLVLSGMGTVPSDGLLSVVRTGNFGFHSVNKGSVLTQTTLTPTVPVANGQVVAVTVVISFS